MKKRFSMRNKLLIIFGLLIVLATSVEGLLAIRTARRAVVEKIETHLKDKATDTAEIIDGRINAFFQFLEGIARMPVLRDSSLSNNEKLSIMQKEVAFNADLHEAALFDLDGFLLTSDERKISVKDYQWFQTAIKGQRTITEPFISVTDGKLVITFAVPIYDENNIQSGVLGAVVLAEWLSNQINDIVLGKTGYCYILGLTGTTIAHKKTDLVTSQDNILNNVKTNSKLTSLATFTQHALKVDESAVGYYEYNDNTFIASYAHMKTADWTIIIRTPVHEFMGSVDELRFEMLVIGMVILLGSLIIVFFVARGMVKPVNVVVTALKDIAQGEGDLTVRLPITGNDEITDLSQYFNQTISKIGSSIQNVGVNANAMEDIGNELATNMTETASAVH